MGPGSWVPCVTSPGLSRPGGALFVDLPANILGCIVMGFMSPADLLLLRHPLQTKAGPIVPGTPWAAIPRTSALQHHAALLLGLRTGFCGCLTTFASWLLQMVEMMVGTSPSARKAGTEWFEALCGLAVGCLASQAALSFGQHMATTAARVWHERERAAEAARVQPPPAPTGTSLVVLNVQGTTHTDTPQQPDGHNAAQPRSSVLQVTAPGAATPSPAGVPIAHRMCDVAAAFVLTVLTAVSIAFIVVVATDFNGDEAPGEQHGRTEFSLWVSLLLSPIGCLLRWRLSGLNTRPATSTVSWFPLGTWLANQGGCLLDYIMSLLLIRLNGVTELSSDVVSGVMTGVGGSLSTVSTWVVELQKLNAQAHENQRAAVYFFGSLVPAVAVGLLVYGTAAWTA